MSNEIKRIEVNVLFGFIFLMLFMLGLWYATNEHIDKSEKRITQQCAEGRDQ